MARFFRKCSCKLAASSSAFVIIVFQACVGEVEQCDLSGCANQEYELRSLSINSSASHIVQRVDTLSSGQLYIQVGRTGSASLKIGASSQSKCYVCESLLRNAVLTADNPIISGTDTILPLTNLMEEKTLGKLGKGSFSEIIFNQGIRFKRGETRFSYSGDIVLEGSEKIGEIKVGKSVVVVDPSAWQ